MISLNAMNTVSISGATGTASQMVCAIVEEKLCRAVCQNQSIQPSATITYTLENQQLVGTTTFVDLVANGVITYVPKGACGCQTRQMLFNERTTIAFNGSTATNPTPTISLVQGTSDGMLTQLNCTTGHAYQIATIVSVSALYA